jgi:hypothetical protein
MYRRERRSWNRGVLPQECEAFLDGTLAEYWDDRGVAVPVWAWTNLLAHGTAGLIAETAARPYRNRRTSRSWRIARSYLASEIFDLVHPEYTLEEMQAAVLLPIELEMASSAEVGRWSPREWVYALDDAIRNQHSTLGL